MKFAIDVREACREKRTGKGQWVYGFVSELLRRGHEVLLFTDSALPSEWEEHSPRKSVLPSGLRWHRRAVASLRKRSDYDLYISPTSYIVPFLARSSVPFVPVVHDLIAFRHEPHERKATMIERLTLQRTLKYAKHICAVSESTKSDLLERFRFLDPKDITVIYAGPMVAEPLFNQPDHHTILCAATLCPRKNQLRLIHAYSSLPKTLRDQYRLLLVGSRGWKNRKILDAAERTPGVEWRGFVSPEEYNALLSTCDILALPSLYEGFGMQVLDALQRGIPVLTSSRGSLPEVTGECAVLVDPESTEAIAEGLQRLLKSRDLQANLRLSGPSRAAHFSWKRTVDYFLAAVKQLQ
ncbi:hypothetical protein A2454_06770 [Candidatus Peribacteria bacterium RIFOXYC2_FULL_55_14]|nr:MAG: hypothetical protein UY85_C0060G0003 [Candidatus Peribacteria bacterium GW2011_GWB1_54_5]KKW40224.1 MAG: hypothetical protein UY87_C0026G0017 [Candidatus Peribacteria bacterium GW2011_GWC2_54_8]KKW43102.1 MAG: hypothetical protein UY90_C0031G0020 [Candidatus Peregrinibacteria bacterium GW2011_GWA2_54_9]OGJ72107.1 MAG: hypothetical protein A2198_04540 [Candidatus Peribacteria bacterium RIFOXYA1_FULL_56_14]OGJ74121.1 MAG: hypothetical protein A2217_00560 [Candidatus Peribacteria bacterium